MSSGVWSTHPWIKKSSIKLIMLCVYVCDGCTYVLGSDADSQKRNHPHAERLGKMPSLFFIFFRLVTCHTYPTFETNVPQYSMLFFSVWMILKPSKSIKYECDSTVCQNTTKTSCNMEFGFEWVSEGFSWWLVRRDVTIVCLLSEVLQGGEKNDSLPATGQTEPFNLCSSGTDHSTLPTKFYTPTAAVTLTGADLCNYNPCVLVHWKKSNPTFNKFQLQASHSLFPSPAELCSFMISPIFYSGLAFVFI